MSKQDRQGVRTAADLERKWQFGKQFTEIMGIANDAREAAYKVESELRNEILEQKTSLERNTEQILMAALQSYVETSDFDSFKTTMETEFSVWADGITGKVTLNESKIDDVNSDLQEKFNLITKYFTFDVNGMTIGEVDNQNKVIIDNDEITIQSGNRVVQQFKVDGTALIPILTVDTAFNLLGLHMSATDTHIDCVFRG